MKRGAKAVEIINKIRMHVDGLAEAQEKLREAQKQLEKAVGKVEKARLQERISPLEKSIAGHRKEMNQYRNQLRKEGVDVSDPDWGQILGGMVAGIIAPMTTDMANEEGMPGWGVAAGVAWDVLSWVDPVFLTDLAEWWFLRK